jgi:hypothetical protein
MRKTTKKSSLQTSATTLGRGTFAAISAVEGLKLSAAGRKRVSSPLSLDERRAEVLNAYLALKGKK